MEEIAPRNRLGYLLRTRRNVMEKTLRTATIEIQQALGTNDFTTVVLGEIERGLRPATMEELTAISHVLDVGIDVLRQHAVEWHESVWDGKPRYELQPGETQAATLHALSHTEAMDELRGAAADMQRGAALIAKVIPALEPGAHDLAIKARATWELLTASVNRISGVLDPDRMNNMKVTFMSESDDGEG